MDNSEGVVTEWSGLQSIPQYRYSVTDAIRQSGSIYSGSLTISPLADQDDDGTYTCTVTVTGGTNAQSATASDAVTITVTGKYYSLCTYCLFITLSLINSSTSSSSDHI